jgi:hypothetical protein
MRGKARVLHCVAICGSHDFSTTYPWKPAHARRGHPVSAGLGNARAGLHGPIGLQIRTGRAYVPSTPTAISRPPCLGLFNSTNQSYLTKGKLVRTLRDAADHVVVLPKAKSALPHWQLAVGCLMAAAEKRGPMMMARIAVVKALGHDIRS